jgi:hypothetical protein
MRLNARPTDTLIGDSPTGANRAGARASRGGFRLPRAALPAVATSVVAALLATAGPVAAAERTFADRRGDVGPGVDLQTVRVVNEKNVRVVVQHRDLVRSFRSAASMTVYLDTVPGEPGPEFALAGGLFEGTDYMLVRTDGWRLGNPVNGPRCDYVQRIDYARDISRIRISRACLDRPGRVRVAVVAGAEDRQGRTVTDWLVARRHLTAWVPRG